MPFFCEVNLRWYNIRKINTRKDQLGRTVATLNGKVVPFPKVEEMSEEEISLYLKQKNETNNHSGYNWGVFA
jgi:hypothetical protein